MARIAGVDLPKEKRVEIGLTYIYGIGHSAAKEILAATKINPDTRVKDLTKDEEALIRDYIDKNFTVEGDLRRNVALDIKRLVEIQCYRGDSEIARCLCAASVLRQTLVPVKVRSALSPTRRSNHKRRNIHGSNESH